MNLLKEIENEQMAKLTAGKEIPDFQPGDTLVVNVKIVEGERSRVQAYEGVCIGRAGAGLNENFTVRKISYGEGVERVFPLYSPMIDSITVVRRGKVRRAKLYYLRGLRGKSARIVERQDHAGEQAMARGRGQGLGQGGDRSHEGRNQTKDRRQAEGRRQDQAKGLNGEMMPRCGATRTVKLLRLSRLVCAFAAATFAAALAQSIRIEVVQAEVAYDRVTGKPLVSFRMTPGQRAPLPS